MFALDSSYETATSLDFYHDTITSFPFDQLSYFSRLSYFRLYSQSLSGMQVPADAFNGLTSLEQIDIKCFSGAIFVGTFKYLPNLKRITLNANGITSIPTNFINTGSSNLKNVDLELNHIASVEPGAFDIVEGMSIRMGHNSLSTLEEATWRPHLEVGGHLGANGNPLNCGCDIAWLFDEDQLLNQVSGDTYCANGKNIYQLDPSMFDNC
ncbi:unnamed protein product [Meganyctiphanes norvegica]|uniref:Uncharacterized protein n=2 Tax=Meganyctiphanes norvegica TaxID=48144 RepID=A0AAV2S3Q3_MEGNR